MLEPGMLLTLGVTAVGVVVWSVRQEGRLNAHDKLFELKDRILIEREKLLDERHTDLKARLVRIETKLDAAVGGTDFQRS